MQRRDARVAWLCFLVHSRACLQPAPLLPHVHVHQYSIRCSFVWWRFVNKPPVGTMTQATSSWEKRQLYFPYNPCIKFRHITTHTCIPHTDCQEVEMSLVELRATATPRAVCCMYKIRTTAPCPELCDICSASLTHDSHRVTPVPPLPLLYLNPV